ncbi:fumarylacetoacetate hydrolase family protein [Chloroflexi bacterium TSY]|nr:fumarylacetoacetate hydrolase family protein [Chloroflexi bacterium TSY]
MKFVLYNEYVPGILKGDQIFDVSAVLDELGAHSAQEMVPMMITNWAWLRPRIEEILENQPGVALDSVRLRPPVPKPAQLVCLAGNYLEPGSPERTEFNAFLKSPNSVIGVGDTVKLPPAEASVFHFEPEFAIVIGKSASYLSTDEAMSSVFGYTQFMDVSARGLPGGFFLGKSWHTFGPMGPALVTADEIEAPNELGVRLWVNDEIRHDFSTNNMDRHIAELLVEVTKVLPLEPGDVVPTGTHHYGLEPVKDGDRVRLEIDQMGPALVIQVSDELKRTWD